MIYLLAGVTVMVMGATLILAEREGVRCAGTGIICIGAVLVLLWRMGQSFGF